MPRHPPRDADDALLSVMASLAAAISIIEKTKSARLVAGSDTMFAMMLSDYKRSLNEAGEFLAKKASEPTPTPPEGRRITLYQQRIIGAYRFEPGDYIITPVGERPKNEPLF